MALLINGGRLMTMTGQGSFVGDVLIENGRIVGASPHIAIPDGEGIQRLDASGHVIMPGLIDMYVRDDALDPLWQASLALSSGVTTVCIVEEHEERCSIADSDGRHACSVHVMHPDRLMDHELAETISALADANVRCLCVIQDEKQLCRTLRYAGTNGASMILANPPAAIGAADAIAEAGCSVVLGVQRHGGYSPWEMAAALDALDVPVAVSCCYPAAKLKLLPVCAGLCVRDGMNREHALQTITSTPARLLGMEDRGCIAQGMRADLTIFDGDPLLLATSHVMTIASGRIIRKCV